MPFNKNIVELVKKNSNFRQEVVTGKHSQVVIMSIAVGEDIGLEVHKVDQIIIVVEGQGKAILNGESSDIAANHLIFVPAGTQHNFANIGNSALKLYTVYAPAQHKPGTVQKTKADYEE